MGVDILIITCPPHVAKSLTDELEDHLTDEHSPAKVLKYGVMCKGQHGIVVLACPYPDGFTTRFLDRIQNDQEITGYILVPSDYPSTSEEPQPSDYPSEEPQAGEEGQP